MVMIGIIVCNKIIMYSSFNLHFVYNLPFQTEREDDESKAAITITYCSQCNWMLRASWMAQELLHLQHRYRLGHAGAGHRRDLHYRYRRPADLGAQAGWRFPDAAELKRRVRDVCFPEKALGHVDKPANPA
jgi:selenoprotein W-related protein